MTPVQAGTQTVVCRLPVRCSHGASDTTARFPAAHVSLRGSLLSAAGAQPQAAASGSTLTCRVASGVPVLETDGPSGPGDVGGGSGDGGTGGSRGWGEGGANEGDDEDLTLLTREQVTIIRTERATVCMCRSRARLCQELAGTTLALQCLCCRGGGPTICR